MGGEVLCGCVGGGVPQSRHVDLRSQGRLFLFPRLGCALSRSPRNDRPNAEGRLPRRLLDSLHIRHRRSVPRETLRTGPLAKIFFPIFPVSPRPLRLKPFRPSALATPHYLPLLTTL